MSSQFAALFGGVAVEVAVFTNLVPIGVKENAHFSADKRSKALTVLSDEVQGNYLSSSPAPDDPFGAEVALQVSDIRPLGVGSEWKVRARNPIMKTNGLEWYILVPVGDGDGPF